MKTLLLLIAALPLLAQQDHYIYSLSGTALTLQMPASNARLVEFPVGSAGASVSCAGAQTATLSWNGTAATTTAATPNPVPPTGMPATTSVFTASNVGSGTTAVAYPVTAGGLLNLDLGWFKMGSNSTASNITIKTTGTCTITFMWSER